MRLRLAIIGDPRAEKLLHEATVHALGSSSAKTRFCPRVCFGGSCATSSVGLMGGRLALQLLGALAVIAAALLDPLQAAIGVTGLVGIVLVDAGVHPGLASGFLGIFWINGSGEYSRPGRCGGRRGPRGLPLLLCFPRFPPSRSGAPCRRPPR